MTLKSLRKKAAKLNIQITAERDDVGWGYWLENTGWGDGNFCTSHDEIEDKLDTLAKE